MGSLSAAAALQFPVRLRGIQLGRPVDLLLDTDAWNALGFVVLCGDDSRRFLPLAACQLTDGEIAVGSALMLLEDARFYQERGVSFRSLLGTERAGGIVRDLMLGPEGHVIELVVERDGERVHVATPVRAAA